MDMLEHLRAAFTEGYYVKNTEALKIYNDKRVVFNKGLEKIERELLNIKSRIKGKYSTKSDLPISVDENIYHNLMVRIESGNFPTKTKAVKATAEDLKISERKCWKVLASKK